MEIHEHDERRAFHESRQVEVTQSDALQSARICDPLQIQQGESLLLREPRGSTMYSLRWGGSNAISLSVTGWRYWYFSSVDKAAAPQPPSVRWNAAS